MITVAEADRLLASHVRPLGTASVPLRHAVNCILRETVSADRDYPPFHRVAMDGIAIDHRQAAGGVSRFAVAGVQAAGAAPLALAQPSDCLEVMTGAVLPTGSDCVVRYEDVHLSDGAATLAEGLAAGPMANVHAQGSDCRAGHTLLAPGTRLLAPQIAVLASAGRARVTVTKPPSVIFIATGDELVDVHETPQPHQIRRSNAHGVAAALETAGYADVTLRHAADDRAALRTALGEALGGFDVVIVSGGVSMGKFDLVPNVLAELGADEVFHKVAQRPGKPLWFGVTRDGAPVFGLPGNPVSALVCLYRYVIPHLDAASGTASRARPIVDMLDFEPLAKPLTRFVAVSLTGRQARPVPTNGSGDFLALLPSDGFVEIPAGARAPATELAYFSWGPA